MIFEKSPLYFFISKDTESYYNYLANFFNVNKNKIFILSYKYAIKKRLLPLDVNEKVNLGHVSTLDETEVELIAIIYFSESSSTELDSGEAFKLVEKLANAGVRNLYNSVTESHKDDINILEDLFKD